MPRTASESPAYYPIKSEDEETKKEPGASILRSPGLLEQHVRRCWEILGFIDRATS